MGSSRMTGGGVPPVIVMPQLMLGSATTWLEARSTANAIQFAARGKKLFKLANIRIQKIMK
jgi:hypothetical protein